MNPETFKDVMSRVTSPECLLLLSAVAGIWAVRKAIAFVKTNLPKLSSPKSLLAAVLCLTSCGSIGYSFGEYGETSAEPTRVPINDFSSASLRRSFMSLCLGVGGLILSTCTYAGSLKEAEAAATAAAEARKKTPTA